MIDRLLPCPSCGKDKGLLFLCDIKDKVFYVECGNCQTKSNKIHRKSLNDMINKEEVKLAVKEWNTREV